MPNITRAFAVHARTLELLDARGMADELLTRGVPVYEIAPPGGVTMNLRELPTRFGMLLIVPQSGTENVLGARVDDMGIPVRARRRGRRADPGRRWRDGGVRRRHVHPDALRRRMRRRAQHRPAAGRYRVRGQAVRDPHPARRRRVDEGAGGHAERCHQRARRCADDPVRRRLVSRHRVGPAARAGAAGRTRHAGGDPRLVPTHRRRGLRHDGYAMEFALPVRAQAGASATATAGCSSRATPRTCTRRSAGRG